jgi:hypothetical protein
MSLHDSFIPQYEIQSYNVRIPLTEDQQMSLGLQWYCEDRGDYFVDFETIDKLLAPYGVREIDYKGEYFYMTIPHSEDAIEIIQTLLKLLDDEL